ncbi:MAG TPA: SGNH/GDSL hydrolase family protein [Acidisarcina sp.]
MHWVGSWAASQQIPEPQNSLPADDLRDATLRQMVHLSLGGATIRIRLSNAFGTTPLRLSTVHIARPAVPFAGGIHATTDRALTFSGSLDVIIPSGAEYLSDPIEYPVTALSDLVISIHFDEAPAQQTGHPGSRETSYLAHGNMVSAADLVTITTSATHPPTAIEHWYQIAAVDVLAPSDAQSIVVLGDSITDGHGSTVNGNDRWPDVLARRLQSTPETRRLGVLNQGIGGNHLLTDGLGPNAIARFDRDVLARAGVGYLMVLEGVNDLGGLTRDGDVSAAEHEALVRRIVSAYEQIIARAHSAAIKVVGATILPYTGSGYYHPGAASEADRQRINKWIRSPGHFDSVVDFDEITTDPKHPDRLLPVYDSGDHLHPSPAGHQAMGEAIPLSLFAR